MKTHQRGASIISIMFWAILVILIAMVSIKTVPVLSEYLSIRSTLNKLAGESGLTDDMIRDKFSKQSIMSDISSIKPQELAIQTSQYGGSVIEAKYRREVPLAWNFGLYFDFDVRAGRATGN